MLPNLVGYDPGSAMEYLNILGIFLAGLMFVVGWVLLVVGAVDVDRDIVVHALKVFGVAVALGVGGGLLVALCLIIIALNVIMKMLRSLDR